MATISQQEFLKGGKKPSLIAPASENVGVPEEQKPGFLQRTAEALKKRGSSIVETVKDTATGKISLPEAGLQVGGAIAGGIGDVTGEAVMSTAQALPESIKEPIKQGAIYILQTPAGQKGLEAIGQGMEKYAEWKVNNPMLAKDLESVVNIASLFPMGKGGKVIAEGVETAVEAGVKGAKASGGIIEATGKALSGTAFRPNIAEAERIVAYKAKNPLIQRIRAAFTGEDLKAPVTMAETAARHGLAGITEGQIGVQAKRTLNNIWKNNIEPALNGIKEKITKNDTFSNVRKIIMEEKELGKRKDMLDALDAVADDYKHVSGWTYRTAQDIKSTLASGVPEKVWRGKPIAGSYSNVRKIMADVLREKIYSKIAPEIKEAYLDYGNLLEISARGAKALTEAQMRGGFGSFASTVIDRLALPVRTYGGQVLKKTGEVLKNL